MSKQLKIRHIVFLVPPNSTLLTMVGPLEVFTKAIEQFDMVDKDIDFTYQAHVVSMGKGRQIDTSSGLSILSEGCYTEIDYPIDTLIVTGLARHLEDNLKDEMIEWIKDQAKTTRRICSVCSGAFILAEAGLLDGKKATAHWSRNEALEQMYPLVNVQIARILLRMEIFIQRQGLPPVWIWLWLSSKKIWDSRLPCILPAGWSCISNAPAIRHNSAHI